MSSTQTFYADAVLFDMVCTSLPSSSQSNSASVLIGWNLDGFYSSCRSRLGQSREGQWAGPSLCHRRQPTVNRAVDNLAAFKPYIKEHEMDDEVTKFEESILFYRRRLQHSWSWISQ